MLSKIDLSQLPQCERSLIPHIRRVNYGVARWKLAEIPHPAILHPTYHGWVKVEEFLKLVWSDGDILTASLANILDSASDSSDIE